MVGAQYHAEIPLPGLHSKSRWKGASKLVAEHHEYRDLNGIVSALTCDPDCLVQPRGQKDRTRKKTNSWERRFPGTFRTNVPLILPIFSVFSVGGGPKVPRNFVPGIFFSLIFLLQTLNPRIPGLPLNLKGKEQVVFLGDGPGVSKMSLALEQPQTCTG